MTPTTSPESQRFEAVTVKVLRNADAITIGTWRAVFHDDTDDVSGITPFSKSF